MLGLYDDIIVASAEHASLEDPTRICFSLPAAPRPLEFHLGTLDFVNPNWKPSVGAEAQDSAFVLDLIGKGVLVYQQRYGEWPATLGELWLKDIHHDRIRVNRFHCPVTGAPFAYKALIGDQAARTVLVATSEPVPTKDGKRYIGFLANNTVVWSESPLPAGEVYTR